MRNVLSLILAALCLAVAQAPNALAREWRDSECSRDRGDDYELCTDGESIAIHWDDGSYISGYCDRGAYDFDYKGMSKSEAVAAAKELCR